MCTKTQESGEEKTSLAKGREEGEKQKGKGCRVWSLGKDDLVHVWLRTRPLGLMRPAPSAAMGFVGVQFPSILCARHRPYTRRRAN